MSEDARFEDADEAPLRLGAEDAEDLKVISTLVQDAVFPASEIAWRASRREFALLVNRFRWEAGPGAGRRRTAERVQSVLHFSDVLKVSSQGVDPHDRDVILSVLSVEFEPGEDGAGRVVLTLAGDGALALDVECLSVLLRDVTRPYAAPSGRAPSHPE
ncbi:hypothetical protein BV394_12725 [Brevirhabdus pacifica]|uniref:Uncharacterized protein n=1 Tax=Brevirhabdus pacifica TaxID=1267768 RepID=A0A1U7DKN5_9RHOB|nr:DUF2948 family protein [Brevirhabdus pacifica]APX90485.1 hypothetical protein BV394_12725 [Brevirhabdus pacifica]OWU78501.1 hypothetical protein ATO5_06740 [Loktanella sp. 22II-4b]PJJ85410.1 Protein of unknown function (DUF2948) [Brevirhabdus pacifica]